MDGTRSRSTVRLLDAIAIILIIMAIVLTYMHHTADFSNITAPFERISSMAQEQFPSSKTTDEETQSEVVEQINSTADQMKDDLGLTKAQRYYIKFKAVMASLEQKVTEIPYKPLIFLAILLVFAVKSFIGVVPVSATCLIAAVIFPYPIALIINFMGVGIIFTIRYAMGRRASSNTLKKFIMKSDNLWRIVSDADNSTKKALQETSDKRKAEKEALEVLKKDEKEQKLAELKESSPIPLKLLTFGLTLKKGAQKVKDALLKVPVLSTALNEEDPEKSANGGTGNPIILFAFRMIPFMPTNPISKLFGSMEMDYRPYISISLFGYLLKIVSFTAIGYNISDPFSSKFIVPFIALLYIAGFSLFGVNAFLKYADKRDAERAK